MVCSLILPRWPTFKNHRIADVIRADRLSVEFDDDQRRSRSNSQCQNGPVGGVDSVENRRSQRAVALRSFGRSNRAGPAMPSARRVRRRACPRRRRPLPARPSRSPQGMMMAESSLGVVLPGQRLVYSTQNPPGDGGGFRLGRFFGSVDARFQERFMHVLVS